MSVNFFGGVEALKQGSLKLFPGEVLAIVGANGAGKFNWMLSNED